MLHNWMTNIETTPQCLRGWPINHQNFQIDWIKITLKISMFCCETTKSQTFYIKHLNFFFLRRATTRRSNWCIPAADKNKYYTIQLYRPCDIEWKLFGSHCEIRKYSITDVTILPLAVNTRCYLRRAWYCKWMPRTCESFWNWASMIQ